MGTIEVGRSELAGRTMGVTQKMERRAGLQVLAFMAEVKRLTGYRLTPNEGMRSRADQRLVWNAYALFLAGRGPWAPRAATCYTSIHDEVNHGNAIDFGGPGGAVVPQHVHDVMVQVGPKYGVIWTGANFGEWWHFEVKYDRIVIMAPDDLGATPVVPEHEEEEEMAAYTSGHIATDPKGNIWVCDVFHHTKWNIIRGLKSVEEAMTRLRDYKNLGYKIIAGKQPSRFFAGLDDITDIDYSKAA